MTAESEGSDCVKLYAEHVSASQYRPSSSHEPTYVSRAHASSAVTDTSGVTLPGRWKYITRDASPGVLHLALIKTSPCVQL